MSNEYTSQEIANSVHLSDKTIRNYVRSLSEVHGFTVDRLQRKGSKGKPEYVFNQAQAEILRVLLKPEVRPYKDPSKPLEEITEQTLQTYRDQLLDGIEGIQNESLKKEIKSTFEYKAAVEMKQRYDEFDMHRDMILWVLEQLPTIKRQEYENRILEGTREFARELLVGFVEQLKQEVGETTTIGQVIQQTKKALNDRISAKIKNVDYDYGGYNLLEKALVKVLLNETKQ